GGSAGSLPASQEERDVKNREHGEQEAQDPVVVDRRVHVEDGSEGTDDNAQPFTGAQADPVEEVMQEFSEQPQDDPELVWAQKAAELQDQLLRKEADLQNMRKRHVKDMDNARRFAVESLLGDLFPALDGLAQATSGLQD